MKSGQAVQRVGLVPHCLQTERGAADEIDGGFAGDRPFEGFHDGGYFGIEIGQALSLGNHDRAGIRGVCAPDGDSDIVQSGMSRNPGDAEPGQKRFDAGKGFPRRHDPVGIYGPVRQNAGSAVDVTGKGNLRRGNRDGEVDALHECAAGLAQAVCSRQFPRRIERLDRTRVEIGKPETRLTRYTYNDSFRHVMPLSYC